MNKGEFAEQTAAEYLKSIGYQILECNYRAKYGEIDIIARQQDTLIFAEVKGRSGVSHGMPFEAVNAGKQLKICRTAACYLSQNSLFSWNVRFDIIEIYLNNKKLNHIMNAFDFNTGSLLQ